MTQYKRIAIDLSKAVFTLHGIDRQDRPVLRTNLRRAQMIPFFAKLATTEIAMEACGGAHYWARELIMLGHRCALSRPNTSSPTSNVARMTAMTPRRSARRPGMQFVPVKSVTQQAQGMVLKVRETLVAQRTLLVNTLRGHAAEFGVIAGNGISKIGALLSAIEQETASPLEAKEMAVLLASRLPISTAKSGQSM